MICLFQSGGPTHLDLFDDKPLLRESFNEDLPDSVRNSQRITGMVAQQSRLALQPTTLRFLPSGNSGTQLSELLVHTRSIADEICLVRSMHTDAFNHDPAITFFQTGRQLPGRPSMGAWTDYVLGRINDNLPSFAVLISVSKSGAGQGLRFSPRRPPGGSVSQHGRARYVPGGSPGNEPGKTAVDARRARGSQPPESRPRERSGD